MPSSDPTTARQPDDDLRSLIWSADAKTHVSESRRGAPAFVTHLRPGPPAVSP
jgi:hypothetical protein